MGKVLIFNMESNLTKSIAKKVVELGMDGNLYSWRQENKVKLSNYKAIIISGSSKIIDKKMPTINEEDAPYLSLKVQESEIPILGICYGHQWLVHVNGYDVGDIRGREEGVVKFTHNGNNILFDGIPKSSYVYMKHKWMIDENKDDLENWSVIGNTKLCPIAAIQRDHMYGVQFHPEYKTKFGNKIFTNFLKKICKL